jgi:hypothetical protein
MLRRPQSSGNAELGPVAGSRFDGCAAKDPLAAADWRSVSHCAAKRTLAGVPKSFSACLSIVKAITNRASVHHVDWWAHQPQIRYGP